MNIIDAAKQLKWTDVLISDEGFVAKMDETGTLSYPIGSENTPKLIKRVRKGKEVLVDAV